MRAAVLFLVLVAAVMAKEESHLSTNEERGLLQMLSKLANRETRAMVVQEVSLVHVPDKNNLEKRVTAAVSECKATDNSWRIHYLTGYSDGILRTNNYGRTDYYDNSKCDWTICVPSGKVVRLTFEDDFELEKHSSCTYDKLLIFDGNTDSNRQIGQYCGTVKPTTITTTGNCVRLEFKSDSSAGFGGFQARFLAVSPGSGSSGGYVPAPTPAPATPAPATPAPATPAPATPAPSNSNDGLSPAGCGTNRFMRRIMNGYASSQGQWPWIVHMRAFTSSSSYMQCGGSLINDEWVVTAAHCLETNGQWITDPSKVQIHLGEHNVQSDDDKDYQVRPSRIIIHPSRRMGTTSQSYDIALIKLSTRVTFGQYVNPVCMPSYDGEFTAGAQCYVSGWGKTHMTQGTSLMLLHLDLTLITNTDCARSYGTVVQDDMICAKRTTTLASACQGDSGGPLVCMKNGAYTLVGVVSFGAQCGKYSRITPNAFASTQHFRSWISNTIAANK